MRHISSPHAPRPSPVMIWGDEIESELGELGKPARYPANSWLPENVNGHGIVRYLVHGHVDSLAQRSNRPMLVGRCGVGELLGVFNHLYPENRTRLRYRTVSEIECREISWRELHELSRQRSHLGGILNHIAQTRLYSIAIALHPAFSCLNLEERSILFEHAIVRLLTPGEQLISKQGERSHLYLLVDGDVDIMSGDKRIARRSKGEILGEISMFGFSQHPTADVVADSYCEILEFRDQETRDLLERNPVFRQRITALIETRIRP